VARVHISGAPRGVGGSASRAATAGPAGGLSRAAAPARLAAAPPPRRAAGRLSRAAGQLSAVPAESRSCAAQKLLLRCLPPTAQHAGLQHQQLRAGAASAAVCRECLAADARRRRRHVSNRVCLVIFSCVCVCAVSLMRTLWSASCWRVGRAAARPAYTALSQRLPKTLVFTQHSPITFDLHAVTSVPWLMVMHAAHSKYREDSKEMLDGHENHCASGAVYDAARPGARGVPYPGGACLPPGGGGTDDAHQACRRP